MLKRALVVGASSGIGAELARVLAREGFHVGLVARRQDKLDELVTRISGEFPDRVVKAWAHDVCEVDEVPALFEEIVGGLDGLDLIVYSAGVMPRVEEDEYDTAKDKRMVDVNVTGCMAWLNPAAERFSRLGAGTIVGISSVAGDRGRKGAPAYCATKAAVTTYMESLRNRVALKGVDVITIKPGPVATPMTEGLDKLPMLIQVEDAAEQIWKGIAARANVRYVPMQWQPIMTIIRHIPSVLFRRLGI